MTPENENREITGLLEALQAFRLDKGLILTYDQEYSVQKDAYQINVVPVWK